MNGKKDDQTQRDQKVQGTARIESGTANAPLIVAPEILPPAAQPWPRIRLYVMQTLATGADILLTQDQAHYIQHVMRQLVGAPIRLFNGTDGEWIGSITHMSRKQIIVTVGACVRPQQASSDVWLVFAPVKKNATDLIIQKATELGVSHIYPVQTYRSVTTRINQDRFCMIATQAAEQCERLDIPICHPIRPLGDILADWPQERVLVMADEAGGAPLSSLKANVAEKITMYGCGALVGPEGGFAPEDRSWLDHHPSVKKVSLGPRILRAETAALVLVSRLTLG